MQDPVADMITRVRNAQAIYKSEVAMPFSSIKKAIAEVLKSEGYITDYRVETIEGKEKLSIVLKYYEEKSVISEIKKISKPGLRVYKAKNELPKEMDGLGIEIVSTSKGIVSDRRARELGCGGEILCTVC